MGKYDVGTVHQKFSNDEFEIVEYVDDKHRKIKFTLSCNERVVSLSSLSKSSTIMDSCNEKYAVGKMFITNENCKILITEIVSLNKRKINFLDYDNLEVIVNRSSIRVGSIKNPYYRSVFGVGYIGVGKYEASKQSKQHGNYKLWISMLRRTTDINNKIYKDVTVCKDWLNYQNFAKWYEDNFPHHIKNIKFDLDKDLLQYGVCNKIYSPSTCVFLPQKVNRFLANVMKNNTTGFTGVNYEKDTNKYRGIINDFETGKSIKLGRFQTPEEASQAYKTARAINAEKAKQYLRDLNYLPESIIQLIK